MTLSPFEFVDLTDRGRGFGPITPPPGFPNGDKNALLTAIEELFKPRFNPQRDNSYIAAVRKLALYAAGKLNLTAPEYAAQHEVADEYEGVMRAPVHGYATNAELALFVIRHASERAKREGLVPA